MMKTATDRHHARSMCSVPTTRCLRVLIMAALLLGRRSGASGNSHLLEGLVSEYLKEEGQLEIEGRSIVYKAYLREFSFPAVYDAKATDTTSDVTASTSEEDKFRDPQDAYHKAVANLLAILRQKGLMKDSKPNPKPTPTPPPISELEPKPEQPQSKEPEMDPTPGGDSVSEPVKQGPGPDSEMDGSHSENSGNDLQNETNTYWQFVPSALCTIVISAVLVLIPSSPLTTLTVGSIGILLVGLVIYFTLGWNIFWNGFIAIAAFVFIEIIRTAYKKLRLTIEELQNLIQPIIKPAAFLLEVVPDSEGSYEGQKMKPACPTSAMLNTNYNYQLWSACKGLAFILNNSDFKGCEREGSQIDRENMIHLLQELGYKIVPHEDLTGQQITGNFKEFAAMFNQKGASYDSAVIVLMSHGEKGVILGTDRAEVKLRDLQGELQADKCPGLKGKPKLYFVQACRGNLGPSGVPPVEQDGPCPASEGSSGRYRDVVTVQPDTDFAERIHDTADVHFAYSTTDGYLSLRSEVHGSFFVQALCEVFFARAHLDNLDTLMNKVTDRVNRKRGKLYNHETEKWIVVNQTPECVKRMRKAFYFFPKYSTEN